MKLIRRVHSLPISLNAHNFLNVFNYISLIDSDQRLKSAVPVLQYFTMSKMIS